MGAPSAIPRPLKKIRNEPNVRSLQPLLEVKKSFSEARHPSYEGNGYQEEISSTNLHTRQASTGSQSVNSDVVPPKLRSRLPAPIKVAPPYASQLRVASNDTYRNDAVPKPSGTPWALDHPKPDAWPNVNIAYPLRAETASEFAPPIPAKSPEHWASKRGLRSEQLVRENTSSHQGLIHPALREDGTEREMLRIVSKENIRAALGNLTPESSIEDLRTARAKTTTRVASPPRLETYNSHMFPRKDARPNGF